MLAEIFHTMSRDRAEQAEVGDEEAADAFFGGPEHVLERVAELAQAADLITVRAPVFRSGVRPRPVTLTWPDEQAHLNAGLVAGLGHVP
jgi:hypothetical protein